MNTEFLSGVRAAVCVVVAGTVCGVATAQLLDGSDADAVSIRADRMQVALADGDVPSYALVRSDGEMVRGAALHEPEDASTVVFDGQEGPAERLGVLGDAGEEGGSGLVDSAAEERGGGGAGWDVGCD